MTISAFSCQDFLDEKQVSTLTQDYYDTEGGLDASGKEKILKKEVIFGEARGVHNGCRPEWTPSFLYDLKNSRVRLPSG